MRVLDHVFFSFPFFIATPATFSTSMQPATQEIVRAVQSCACTLEAVWSEESQYVPRADERAGRVLKTYQGGDLQPVDDFEAFMAWLSAQGEDELRRAFDDDAFCEWLHEKGYFQAYCEMQGTLKYRGCRAYDKLYLQEMTDSGRDEDFKRQYFRWCEEVLQEDLRNRVFESVKYIVWWHGLGIAIRDVRLQLGHMYPQLNLRRRRWKFWLARICIDTPFSTKDGLRRKQERAGGD